MSRDRPRDEPTAEISASFSQPLETRRDRGFTPREMENSRGIRGRGGRNESRIDPVAIRSKFLSALSILRYY